jgi:hypothetical protein
MAMESGEGEQVDAKEDARVIVDPENGQEWVVEVTGQSSSGIPPLRTIPLLELTFARPDDPQTPLRRATGPGEDLAELLDAELLDLLRASKPHRPPLEAPSGKERRAKKTRKGRPRS